MCILKDSQSEYLTRILEKEKEGYHVTRRANGNLLEKLSLKTNFCALVILSLVIRGGISEYVRQNSIKLRKKGDTFKNWPKNF